MTDPSANAPNLLRACVLVCGMVSVRMVADGTERGRPDTCSPQHRQWVHQHSTILRLFLHPTGEHRGLHMPLQWIPSAPDRYDDLLVDMGTAVLACCDKG